MHTACTWAVQSAGRQDTKRGPLRIGLGRARRFIAEAIDGCDLGSVRHVSLAVGCLAAVLCLASGVSYTTVSPSQLTVPLLLAVALLGSGVLVAVTLWQHSAR